MRRLFFYLFYHILPVIGQYIIFTYFGNIQQNIHNQFQQLRHNIEIQHFMNIIKFLKRINISEFIREIKQICNLDESQFQSLLTLISNNLNEFSRLSPQQEVNSIRQSIHQSRNNSIANVVGNVVISSATTGVNPMEVVQFIGFVISIPFRIIFFFMQFAG